MASRKDYYDILGIRRDATAEDIEKAYLKLARAYQAHPVAGGRAPETRFKEISEAYEVLSNREKRKKYDLTGLALQPPEFWEYDLEEEEAEDLHLDGFEDVFTGEASSLQPKRGKDLLCRLDLNFTEAVEGAVKKITFRSENPCPRCLGKGMDPAGAARVCQTCGGAGQIQIGLLPHAFTQTCNGCGGTGKKITACCTLCRGKGVVTKNDSVTLKVPPGIGEGSRIYLQCKGQSGSRGGPRGDLVVTVRVRSHPRFKRRGDDLLLEVPLTIWEAALGATIRVPTLQGTVSVSIPAGSQYGAILRLKGKGVPSLLGSGRGDEVLFLKVVVPQEVDEKTRKILGELKRLNSWNPRKEWNRRSKQGSEIL